MCLFTLCRYIFHSPDVCGLIVLLVKIVDARKNTKIEYYFSVIVRELVRAQLGDKFLPFHTILIFS